MYFGFPNRNWTTLRKLIWLHTLRGAAAVIKVVTGTVPLTLENAISCTIHSLTQYGLCTQSGTPTPSAPVDIMCNNGALKYSANMANVNEQTARVGYYISASGAVLADTYNWYYQAFIPCKPNTAYTLSMSQSVYYVTISEYRTAEDSGFIVRKNGSTGSNTSLTITTGANTNFLRFGANVDRAPVTLEEVLAINWMLNIGTAMDYQPYVEGGIYADGTPEVLTVSADGAEMQTASVPMLLSVGGYKDEAELISGIKTGKVGVSMYCGSADENWSRLGTNAFAVTNSKKIVGKHAMLCSHYTYTAATSARCSSGEFGCSSGTLRSVYFKNELYDTVDDWRAALAADPIIVVYPLATATTEQTTAQHLHTTAGTNVVDVTANVSPISIDVEYYGNE